MAEKGLPKLEAKGLFPKRQFDLIERTMSLDSCVNRGGPKEST